MAEELPDGVGAGNPGVEGGGGEPGQPATARTLKGKSCKGCLYYSSLLKSGSRNPVCVGISRTLPTAPLFIMGESEMKATQDGHDLSDFKYACIGYSIFVDNNDEQEHRAQFPFCAGIELLVEKRVSTSDHVAAPVQKEVFMKMGRVVLKTLFSIEKGQLPGAQHTRCYRPIPITTTPTRSIFGRTSQQV
nr:PREDICTED: uncharacterized protein LOC104000460 isoform X2 [Musa acuminata subsp. malaccensis]